eukprot:15240564-Alexandrium_andersonii.AAC.1
MSASLVGSEMCIRDSLMCVYDKIVFHLLDRCTRWRAACTVAPKEGTSLTDALNRPWIGVHGPMRELIMDGE